MELFSELKLETLTLELSSPCKNSILLKRTTLSYNYKSPPPLGHLSEETHIDGDSCGRRVTTDGGPRSFSFRSNF